MSDTTAVSPSSLGPPGGLRTVPVMVSEVSSRKWPSDTSSSGATCAAAAADAAPLLGPDVVNTTTAPPSATTSAAAATNAKRPEDGPSRCTVPKKLPSSNVERPASIVAGLASPKRELEGESIAEREDPNIDRPSDIAGARSTTSGRGA